MRGGMYVDANLLVLLVAGLTERRLIGRHRRLREYSDRLARLVDRAGEVFVTPNTLTEASNLLAQHGQPERSRLLETLRKLIAGSPETVIASREASGDGAFLRLGLTDAVLLKAVSPDVPLVTVDLELYLAASVRGDERAINFNHLRFTD